jgi:hypothetical protein
MNLFCSGDINSDATFVVDILGDLFGLPIKSATRQRFDEGWPSCQQRPRRQ